MKHLIIIITCLLFTPLFGQNELKVIDAIEKALENNFQIKLVEGNYQVAKLQNSWGQAGLIPTFAINVRNSASLQDNTNNPATFFPGVLFNDNLQASLDMNWTIFSGFGIRINKERFDQLQAQTKGNAIVVIETTIYDVIMNYYMAVVQEKKQAVMLDLLNFSKDKLTYHQLKNDLGISTSLDLLEFENQVLTDSTNLLLQNLSVENAKRNLNLVMAEDINTDFILTEEVAFDKKEASFEELQNQMLANNQGLKNQFINLELQELNLQAKQSAYYPVISLGLSTSPSVGYIELLGDEGFSSSTSAWSHSGNINLQYNLFQGWNRKRNSEIAEIQVGLAEMQIDELTLKMNYQLKNNYDLYDTRSQIEYMSQLRLENANKLWVLGQEKYSLGLINVFNLNDIKLSYQSAVLSYYDRLYELLQSHYDIMRLTGQISQEFKISENFDSK
jgi:outer membrane protein TolC